MRRPYASPLRLTVTNYHCRTGCRAALLSVHGPSWTSSFKALSKARKGVFVLNNFAFKVINTSHQPKITFRSRERVRKPFHFDKSEIPYLREKIQIKILNSHLSDFPAAYLSNTLVVCSRPHMVPIQCVRIAESVHMMAWTRLNFFLLSLLLNSMETSGDAISYHLADQDSMFADASESYQEKTRSLCALLCQRLRYENCWGFNYDKESQSCKFLTKSPTHLIPSDGHLSFITREFRFPCWKYPRLCYQRRQCARRRMA